MDLFQELFGLVTRFHIRFGDDLYQRDPGTVVINKGYFLSV
ncbi:MAG: hypothetical protein UW35_C0008G0002 [Candidatus Collierbacteria bacterium GW2011_GWF2_44_15]|uniref:Uncharacterized protein n=1 Tax=Candidatus Collierbacteria bacterium GW2011_GWF2_44_15 TaxID=1618404 RepID=A0A0G1JS95_9BACT|nr:MAG: hypothetical protein UW35_C0008G0002 [Candidatus Collierbacteria bacterium GW2011_GWF2_44_15]